MNKFRHALFEGEVYKLTQFRLMRNCGKFRATSHEFKIMFNATTKLIPCQNPKIRSLGLALLKTVDIAQTNGRSDYLLDFMGILMFLDLADEMGKVRCAIFGDLVDVVCDFISGSPSGLPVVVIQLARVNFYKGHVGIKNVMNASKIYWNPEWPIAVEFKNSLAVHEVETDVCIGTISDCGRPVCLREEFLKLYKLKVVVSDGIESAQLIMFQSECFTLLIKGHVCCGEFPTEIQELVGKEFLFRVENRDELLYGLDGSFKVKRACCDSSIIDDFKEALDDETPLKLKFAPPFTKMANIEGDSCRVDLTTDINVAATVLDVSPISIVQSSSTGGQSSSSAHEGGEGNKRELDNSVDASSDRLKRPKRKVLKTEKP
ncbi:Nucleic acid-binding, OB-fold [Sesbania bispinosa]|nr:Nucleic acid-binding, OB-fold [Sesbania bispinosa]